jgi:hypothetical protein
MILAKAKRYGFKDLLLEKLSIAMANDDFDEVLDIGEKMAKTINLNGIAYTEFTLSIDIKASHVKIALKISEVTHGKIFNLEIKKAIFPITTEPQ